MNISETIHKGKMWGKFPSETIVTLVYKHVLSRSNNTTNLRALDVGSGIGAHTWALTKIGFQVTSADVSQSALGRIEQTCKEFGVEKKPNLLLQDFCEPLKSDSSVFDLAIDNFCLYTLEIKDILKAFSEIKRSLKPGGIFIGRMWGTKTDGYGAGKKISEDCFTDIPYGPLHEMGRSSFVSLESLKGYLKDYTIITIDEHNSTL